MKESDPEFSGFTDPVGISGNWKRRLLKIHKYFN